MSALRPNNLLSKREEERLIETGRRVLLNGEYPNPDRVGCPGPAALQALAERKIDLRSASEWVLHVGSCSPCFAEYTAFQEKVKKRKALELVLASAVLLILVGGVARLWKANWFRGMGEKPNVATVMPFQRFTLDLRNRLVLRGERPPSSNTGPIQLPRERLDLTVLLPAGSQPGNYEVQVFTQLDKPLVTTTGMAVNENGLRVLKVKLDLSKLGSRIYLLAIGPSGTERRVYPLVLK